ncbi:MAG: glycerophosphoryl diester phosphodiesterase [Trebonia sp.]|nr:glycerophosphoryl diester phosphodiesterase [Trebonia sp.]
MPSSRVMVSAHAGHANPGTPSTVESYRQALASGADYIEFDIRQTADGQLVAAHDSRTAQGNLISSVSYGRLCDLVGREVPRVADILTAIKGRAKGHLDLKVVGREDTVVRLALDIMGPGEFIITTLEDVSVAAIRSRFGDPEEVPVALSLGRDMNGAPRTAWLRTRASELWPLSRVRACGANWVAVEHRLARAGVLRQCRRHQVNVMVWTVNEERKMRYWLAGHRADVLITDRPALAVSLRSQAG